MILTPGYHLPASETVYGAVDPFATPVQHVGVHHLGLYIPMAQEFLNRADVIAIFQKVCGNRMPQRMAIGRLSQPYFARGPFDSSL
jgi:hypothetical protein